MAATYQLYMRQVLSWAAKVKVKVFVKLVDEIAIREIQVHHILLRRFENFKYIRFYFVNASTLN